MSSPAGQKTFRIRLERNPSQEAVFRFLTERPGQLVRPKEIETRFSGSTVRRVLVELRERGEVKHLPRSHRWTVGQFFRYSYGIKWLDRREELLAVIPVHHKYYGALVQAWSLSTEALDQAKGSLQTILLDALGSFLGYPEDEWWFLVDSGEGVQEVPFSKRLAGRFEWRIEDEDGSVVSQGSGDLSF